MKPNAEVQVTMVTQAANKLLNTKDSNKYYVVIETAKGKLAINIGETNYKELQKLTT